jgi:hypothetical protein
MKKLSVLLIIAFGILMISCKPTPQQAADFNNKIIDQTDAVITAYNQFIKTWQRYEFGDPDLSEMKGDFKELQDQIKTSMEEISNLKKFDGKNEFKDAATEYLGSYKSVVEKEWSQIMDLLKKGEDFGKSDASKCDKLAKAIDEQTGDADSKFFKFQKDFAKKYNFKLEK